MPTTTGKATDLITFSRASLATVTDADGRIKWAAHNLLLASEQLDTTSWSTSRGTIAANNIAAPNGTITADKFTEDSTGNTRSTSPSGTVSTVAGAAYTFSAFLKNGDRRYVSLVFVDLSTGANGYVATFDLSGVSRTVQTVGTGATPTASITPLSDGWYYCSVTGVATSTAMLPLISPATTATPTLSTYGRQSYTGDGAKNFYLWGAHLYRSDLGGMQANASAYPMYNPTTPKNLLGWSEAFDNAAWGKTSLTATANAIAAPNGSLSADTLSDGTATSNHYAAQTISTLSGSTYTASVYAKNNDGTFLILNAANLSGASTFASAIFNLATGTVATSAALGTGYAVVSTSITSVGDGWYRCALVFTAGTTTPTSFCVAMSNAASIGAFGLLSYTGTNRTIFLWGAQLSDSASLDPYVGSYGAAPTAAAYNGPRLDYNASTLAPLGLLVEEQRTNLAIYSSDFSNANWVAFGTKTITSNYAVAPDGTSTATLLSSIAGNGISLQNMPVAANTAYQFTLFCKETTGTQIRLQMVSSGGTGAIYNQLLTIASGVYVGNGWYRLNPSLTTATGDTFLQVRILTDGSGNPVQIWGAQVEAGAFATSYIPTTASTVTRSADVASVATSQFPYSATEGSVIASVSVLSFSGNRTATNISDQFGFSERTQLRLNSSGQANTVVSKAGVAVTTPTTSNSGTAGVVIKAGYALAANDLALVLNGGTVATNTSVALPGTVLNMKLGNQDGAGAENLNGWIRQITYIPRRLTNAELQQRTSA
jgi:hypothetical protein